MTTIRRTSRLVIAKALLAPALLLAGAESGELAAGSPYVAPGNSSPTTSSQRFVIDAVAGKRLDLGGGVTLPLTAPDGALVVLVPVAGAKTRPSGSLELRHADGSVLDGAKAFSSPRTFSEPDLAHYDLPVEATVVELGRLAPGSYTLRGTGPDAAEIGAVLVAEPQSELVLAARATPLAARSGEPVVIEATLLDAGEAVSGATVKARYTDAAGGHEVTLAERRPGRYRATVKPLATGGLLSVDLRVDATGSLADGRRFARTGLAGTMVTRGGADLELAAVSLDGETLTVDVTGAAARYRLEATFATASGAGDQAQALAYSREDFALAAGEAMRTLRLVVPAAAAGADRVALRLLNIDTLGVEREAELDLAVPGVAELFAGGAKGRQTGTLPASKLVARQQFNEEP